MKKRLIVPVAAIALVGLMGGFASTAQAFPTKTTACTGCHSGPNVPITTTLVSTVGTNATYNFNAPAASAVAVFDGATKIFTFYAGTGQFTVATGKTYTLYSVTGPSTSDGAGSTSVSPVAPVVDTTAPVTVSNALATYLSTASIKLTATDVGTGVANTYFKLDGGAQTTGTVIATTVVGAHSIEFWSVDKAGNVEIHKTASFTVTAPVPVDATAPVTVSNAVASYVSNAVITLSATDVGTGVANTYYILDGGLQSAGTSVNVSTLGAHTLQFWSVDKTGNIELHKTAAFTITAPPVVDTTAPVTVSDAKATYVSTAAIKLTATDAGSGVATTYYKLDGGLQTTGTSVNVTAVGTHTIEFWSVDVAGNAEAHKTAAFTITAAVPVPSTGLSTVTLKVPAYRTLGRTATLTNTVTGAKITAIIGRYGNVVFLNVPAGTYKLTISTRTGSRYLRTITVTAPVAEVDDDDVVSAISPQVPRD